jgi:pimeloyl-ACP methyl ester carboxylesterase
VPGTLALSVERRLAGPSPSRDAVVALAGGPGQAALPLAEYIPKVIAPALGTRDLLLLDQRGTGTSDPLACSALERFSNQPVNRLFEECAQQIGPARGAFTTAESVNDIEELRRAGGYEKLVLYGTSYGTKVALEYAERYPQNVEAMVLDSVVPSSGWEPFHLPSFSAIKPVMDELCSAGACAGITGNPVADLASLDARLEKHPLSGSVYNGAGRRRTSTLSSDGLLNILEAGDLNPALRALLPAAVRSALQGDAEPLLRLHLLSEGLIPNVPTESGVGSEEGEASSDVDEVLYWTTICEESPFPWSRSGTEAVRLAEAHGFINSQPAAAFYPFSAASAFTDSPAAECAAWPDASPPPPAQSPLPDVPTLILSGEQDLRTPTSGAQQVAALIPDAQLLLVPFTGHSVIGSDLSGCAAKAVSEFFSGAAVAPCAATRNDFAPTPVPPHTLAHVRAPSRLGGRPGRTLAAVLDTIVDLARQVVGATLEFDAQLPSGSSFGGLRGGYADLTTTALVLHGYQFVPGVAVTGTLPVRNGSLGAGTLRISGGQAARGTVRISAGATRVTGTLAGKHFSIAVVRGRLASAGSGWPTAAQVSALLARPRLTGQAPRLR